MCTVAQVSTRIWGFGRHNNRANDLLFCISVSITELTLTAFYDALHMCIFGENLCNFSLPGKAKCNIWVVDFPWSICKGRLIIFRLWYRSGRVNFKYIVDTESACSMYLDQRRGHRFIFAHAIFFHMEFHHCNFTSRFSLPFPPCFALIFFMQ